MVSKWFTIHCDLVAIMISAREKNGRTIACNKIILCVYKLQEALFDSYGV